ARSRGAGGRTESVAASGPSPPPVAPWHDAHVVAYRPSPSRTSPSSARSVATYVAAAQRSSGESVSSHCGIAVPATPIVSLRYTSTGETVLIPSRSARLAGGGPCRCFAFGPSPRPVAP